MATLWTLVNKTNVLLCEVWVSQVAPLCIDYRGKNKIYENQVMYTYDIHVWYPGWLILGGASLKEWMIFNFGKNMHASH